LKSLLRRSVVPFFANEELSVVADVEFENGIDEMAVVVGYIQFLRKKRHLLADEDL